MAKRKRKRKKKNDGDEDLGKKFITAFVVMFALGVALFFAIWLFF